MVLAYCQFQKGIMGNFPVVLTPAEHTAYCALANRHGYDMSIRFAEAVETLSDDSESTAVRSEAQSVIKALARKGVVQYNQFTDMVRIARVRVQTNASAPAPPDAIPSNLPKFITQLSLSRARAVWEMFNLHALSGNGTLPPRLAEHVIRRLRDRKSTRLNSSHSAKSRMPSSA